MDGDTDTTGCSRFELPIALQGLDFRVLKTSSFLTVSRATI